MILLFFFLPFSLVSYIPLLLCVSCEIEFLFCFAAYLPFISCQRVIIVLLFSIFFLIMMASLFICPGISGS